MRVSLLTRALAPTLLVLALLSGCGLSADIHRDTFKPYAPDVVQGNFVSREQRQMLREGMSRVQVRDILGTPLLTSVFHADRWDYVFAIRRQGVPAQQFRLSLQFEQDALKRIEGDELPSEAEFVQRLSPRTAKAPVPALEASEEQLRKYPPARAPSDTPASAPLSPVSPQVSSPTLPANYPPLDAPTR